MDPFCEIIYLGSEMELGRIAKDLPRIASVDRHHSERNSQNEIGK